MTKRESRTWNVFTGDGVPASAWDMITVLRTVTVMPQTLRLVIQTLGKTVMVLGVQEKDQNEREK